MDRVKLTGDIIITFGAKKVSKHTYSISEGDAEFIFNFNVIKNNWWIQYVNKALVPNIVAPMPTEFVYVHELQEFWLGVMRKELKPL